MRATHLFPALLCTLACGSDTARTRIDFAVEAGALAHDGPITTVGGWTVELSTAELSVAGLYFFEGEPLFARVDRRPMHQRLLGMVIGTAYAHPGHYVEGEALADLLQPVTLDLLAPDQRLGQANGVSGAYNSVRVVLKPAAALDNHTARIAGTATKDGVTVRFTASLNLDKAIEGVAFGADLEASGGKVHLAIDPAEWVRRIDFGTLDTTQEVELQEGTQPYNAFIRGVENTAAFHFTWIPG